MSFTYYTESRVVNLYTGEPPEVLAFGIPYDWDEVFSLQPMTKLVSEIDLDQVSPDKYPYVFVQLANPATAAEGAKNGGWVLRKLIRKGLKVGTKSEKTGEAFTGVAYGDYKWNADFRSKGSMRYVAQGGTCSKCGRRASDHRVYETVSLREKLKDLINAHKNAKRAGQYMVGMLEIRSSTGKTVTLVADSGFTFPFEKTVAEASTSSGLTYVTKDMLQGKKFLACSGEAPVAGDERLKLPETIDLEKKQKEIQCAAPKLLQAYVHWYRDEKADAVLYLSEVFCGSSDSPFATSNAIPFKPGKLDSAKIPAPTLDPHGSVTFKDVKTDRPQGELDYPHLETAESCNLCRGRVAQMLCGHSNMDKGDQKRLRAFS